MGPGEYLPGCTEGITCIEDLPTPIFSRRSRNYRRRPCPRCGRSCFRHGRGRRTLHDLGFPSDDRPRCLQIVYVVAYCLRSSARPETRSVRLDAIDLGMQARGPWRASMNGLLPTVDCASRPSWRAIRLEWELDLVLEKVDR
jgi:hypothetical protein